MTDELAEHISLLAAPIFAVLLKHYVGSPVPAETLADLRAHAVTQAHALWLDTLARKP